MKLFIKYITKILVSRGVIDGRRNYGSHYAVHGFSSLSKKTTSSFFSRWGYSILAGCILTPFIVLGIWLYIYIYSALPDIGDIKNNGFKQATTITARDGEVLYKLYEENREYIPFEKISPNFVNAIIAIEDQRFWTNAGIDVYGIVRAILRDIGKGDKHGASTITQQLIKNMLLTSEKTIVRKVKEIILAVQINRYIEKEVLQTEKTLSQKEIDRKVKEKIMELYANYIFFGNNAYGIETASKTYFSVAAKDLSIVQAATLASLPKAPSKYDPYTNKDELVGALSILSNTDQEVSDELFEQGKAAIFGKIQEDIQRISLLKKTDEIDFVNFLTATLSFTYQYQEHVYKVAYTPGRKDFVLARMYSDGLVSESDVKKAFLEGLSLTFKRTQSNIVAPHFVFRVINQLEKDFDADVLRKGGLVIKTTLDLKTQKLAEESIIENDGFAKGYGASNASMLYVDSRNGDVLGYVGSKNYADKTIGGENDLVQRPRQPGSTVKPLLYALGFMKLPLTTDSPIYDIPLTIAGNKPSNVDGKFNGLMTIKAALASSRNIPAIKMFLMVGGENPIKTFFQQLGVASLDMEKEIYGYPLAIGAGEIPMYQMVQAYTHLSAAGKPAKLNPILEITNPSGDTLYKKTVIFQDQIIPTGVAYLLWNILSDMENMPTGWRKMFDFPAIKFATKSGTTNVVVGEKKLPRDGRFVAYTPSKVMMFRGGNNDGKPLKETAYGGWLNAPVWRSFSNKLVKNKLISNESMEEVEVKKLSLSKLSGKLASSSTPLALITNALAYIQTAPTQYDPGAKRISLDALCGGVISDTTVSGDIRDAYIINPTSMMPDKRDQQDILNRRAGGGLSSYSSQIGRRLLLSEKSIGAACSGDRAILQGSGEISLSIMQPAAGQIIGQKFSVRHQTKSSFIVKNISIYINNIEVKKIAYTTPTVIDISSVNLPENTPKGPLSLKVVATDDKGFSDTKTLSLVVGGADEDKNPPYLLRDKIKIEKIPTGSGDNQSLQYKVTAVFADDVGKITKGFISQNGSQVASFSNNIVVFTVASLDGLSYVVVDDADNKGSGVLPIGG